MMPSIQNLRGAPSLWHRVIHKLCEEGLPSGRQWLRSAGQAAFDSYLLPHPNHCRSYYAVPQCSQHVRLGHHAALLQGLETISTTIPKGYPRRGFWTAHGELHQRHSAMPLMSSAAYRRHSSMPPLSVGDQLGIPAFVFDIDGVLVRGKKVLPTARQAMSKVRITST